MRCPLFEMVERTKGNVINEVDVECIKAYCAWWDKIYERCDPTGLLRTLNRLTNTLSEIERRMPHAEQFNE